MEEVIELCKHFSVNTLRTENYFENLDIAGDEATRTETRLNILLMHLEDFASNHKEEFMELTFDEFVELLESNSLRIQSEYHAFELVLEWVRHDVTSRGGTLAALMSHLRLPLMMPVEQLERMEAVSEVSSNEECRKLLAEARAYQENDNNPALLQTNRTQVRSDKAKYIFSYFNGTECMDASADFRTARAIISLLHSGCE